MEFEKFSSEIPSFFKPSKRPNRPNNLLRITFELPMQPTTRFLKLCAKRGIDPDITVSKLIKDFVQNKK